MINENKIPKQVIKNILKSLRNVEDDNKLENDAVIYDKYINEKNGVLNEQQRKEVSNIINDYCIIKSKAYSEQAVEILSEIIKSVNNGNNSFKNEEEITLGNVSTTVSNIYNDVLVKYDHLKILSKIVVEKNRKEPFVNEKRKPYDYISLNKSILNIYNYIHSNNSTVTLNPSDSIIYNNVIEEYRDAVNKKSMNGDLVYKSINTLYKSMDSNFVPNLNCLSKNIMNFKFANDYDVVYNEELINSTKKLAKNVEQLLSLNKMKIATISSENRADKNNIYLGERSPIYDKTEKTLVKEHNKYLNDVLNALYTYNVYLYEKNVNNDHEFENNVLQYIKSNKQKDKKFSTVLHIYNEDLQLQAEDSELDYASKYQDSKSLTCLLNTLYMFKLLSTGEDYLAVERVLTDLISNKVLAIYAEDKFTSQIQYNLINTLTKYEHGEISLDLCKKQLMLMDSKVEENCKSAKLLKENIQNALQSLSRNSETVTSYVQIAQEFLPNKDIFADITLLYSFDKYREMSKEFLYDYEKLVNKKLINLPDNISFPSKDVNFEKHKNTDMLVNLVDEVSKASGISVYYSHLSKNAKIKSNPNDLTINAEVSKNNIVKAYNVVMKENDVISGKLNDIINMDTLNVNDYVVGEDVLNKVEKKITKYSETFAKNLGGSNKKSVSEVVSNINTLSMKLNSNIYNIKDSKISVKYYEVDNLFKLVSDAEYCVEQMRQVVLEQNEIDNELVLVKNPILAAKVSLGMTLSNELNSVAVNKKFDQLLSRYSTAKEEDYPKYKTMLMQICGYINNRNEKIETNANDVRFKRVANLIAGDNGLNNSVQKNIIELISMTPNGLQFLLSESVTSITSKHRYLQQIEEINKQLVNASNEEKENLLKKKKELSNDMYKYSKLKEKTSLIVKDFLQKELNVKDVIAENAFESLESYVLVMTCEDLINCSSLTSKVAVSTVKKHINEVKDKFKVFCNKYALEIKDTDINHKVVDEVSKNQEYINEIIKQIEEVNKKVLDSLDNDKKEDASLKMKNALNSMKNNTNIDASTTVSSAVVVEE